MPETRLLNIEPERFPFFCQWEITCRCNLRCVMCYTDCFNKPEMIRNELSTAEILRIMDELAEAGCVELCLTGGEPFSRPDFFEIYEYAKLKGFLIILFTNGTFITQAVADRLAELPPARIEISLHGIQRETFETVTQGAGSYDRCLEAIQHILKLKIPLVLKATAMTLNQNELLEIKRYAQSLGSTVSFKMGESMVPTLEGSESPKRFEIPFDVLEAIEKQDPKMWKEACDQYEEKRTCQSGIQTFHIDAYGQLQLCSGNRRKSYDLRKGHLKEGFYQFLPQFPCPMKENSLLKESACGHGCI